MGLFSFTPAEKPVAAVVLKNGQSVSLYVRSVNPDGTARIQVAGADITARSEMPPDLSLQPGSILKGRVFFENGRVYIRTAGLLFPRGFSFSSFLASNGISPSEAACRVLSFFHVSGMRMDPAVVRRVLFLAAAFPGKEPRAAEAAALLLWKGISLTEENLKAAVDILEGRIFAGDSFRVEDGVLPLNPDAERGKNPESGGKRDGEEAESGQKRGGKDRENAEAEAAGKMQSQSADFFNAFTGRNTGRTGEGADAGLSWHILPFKRNFGGMDCTGSIRFLVSSADGKAIETRVTAVSSAEESGFSADFVFSESGCRFAVAPPPQERQAEKLAHELSKIVKGAGFAVPVEYGFGADFTEAKPVDIEI